MTVRRRREASLLLVPVLTTLAVSCSDSPDPARPLAEFADALSQRDLTGLDLLSSDGGRQPGDQAQESLTSLLGDLATLQPAVTVAGRPTERDQEATGRIELSWPIGADATWTYESEVRLRRDDDGWRVVFSPDTIHPDLAAMDTLALSYTPAGRAPILDGSGTEIVTRRPVVIVGLQPSAVPDVATAVSELTAAVTIVEPAVTFDDLPARLASTQPDAFVEAVTLRSEKYLQIRDQLQAIAGARFRESTLSLAPTASFARALLGTTGQVTKEIMERNPGEYQIGDTVGLSGLQSRYEEQLRGSPGVEVVLNHMADKTTTVLFTAEPTAGEPVTTTLDQAVQSAAEDALAAETRRSALVAIRVRDGAVLAVANGPTNSQLDLALTAQVPPGSTFKVVTALGVLDQGSVTADSVVACPRTLTVDGRQFSNAHDMALGEVPLHVDFAQSCNTAFASLASLLGPEGLAEAAASLGIGSEWDLGPEVFTGTVSSGGSDAERAAAAFGQGTTLVSPMVMAGAISAVARGWWSQPTLVLDPAPAPASAAPTGTHLDASVLAALRSMLREAVTDGTATALAGNGEVYGKTGTAEYDDSDLARTHSWFIGYRGDVAFAVFVEDGGLGSDSAVPITSRFLEGLD